MLNNYPQIDVNTLQLDRFSPLYYAIGAYRDIKIVKILCNHPNTNLLYKHKRFNVTIFDITLIRGNTVALKYYINNFSNILEKKLSNQLILFCLQHHHLLTLELYIKFLFDNKSYTKRKKKAQKIESNALKSIQRNSNSFKELYQILERCVKC